MITDNYTDIQGVSQSERQTQRLCRGHRDDESHSSAGSKMS